MNCALIGPGRMGVNYAKVVQQNPDARLVAVCGNTVETTNRNASCLNVPLYYNNNWVQMIDEHGDIDTVIIATSEWAHVQPFIDCCNAGKNIILEKPVAISLDEANRMKDAYEKAAVKVGVCHTSRFDLRFLEAFRLSKQQALGNIGYIYSRRNADIDAAKRVSGKIPMSFWLTPHDIDLLRWFTGSEVCEVSAVQNGHDKPNNFLLVHLLFRNGVHGAIEISWFGKPLMGQHHSRFDIEGENGRIEVNLSMPNVTYFSGERMNAVPDIFDFVNVNGSYTGATPLMINHFIDAFKNDSPPLVGFDDGWKTIEVCDAIERSLRTSQKAILK